MLDDHMKFVDDRIGREGKQMLSTISMVLDVVCIVLNLMVIVMIFRDWKK